MVERNLAALWYYEIPDVKILGHLKPMNVSSQFKVLLKSYFVCNFNTNNPRSQLFESGGGGCYICSQENDLLFPFHIL